MNVLLRNVLGLVALVVIMQCLAIMLACIRPAWFPWVIGQPTTWSAHPQRMDEWKTMGTQKESLDLLFFEMGTTWLQKVPMITANGLQTFYPQSQGVDNLLERTNVLSTQTMKSSHDLSISIQAALSV